MITTVSRENQYKWVAGDKFMMYLKKKKLGVYDDHSLIYKRFRYCIYNIYIMIIDYNVIYIRLTMIDAYNKILVHPWLC